MRDIVFLMNLESLPKNILFGTVTCNEWICPETIKFSFKSTEAIHFGGGQFISLVVPWKDKWVNRAYSIASNPSRSDEIDLLIKIIPDGAAGSFLPTLKVGDTVYYRKAAGKFTFKSEAAEEVHFICTGTGIAPFYAMMWEHKEKNSKQKFRILCGYRFENEILLKKEMEDLQMDNLTYDCVISRSETWQGLKGRVTQHMRIDPKIHYYLCGVEAMIVDCKTTLMNAGVPEENIFEESYGKAFTG